MRVGRADFVLASHHHVVPHDKQTQTRSKVALFVVPFLVIAGWVMGKEMTLEFPPIEVRGC